MKKFLSYENDDARNFFMDDIFPSIDTLYI